MGELTVQQVLGSRFKTSAEADNVTAKLMNHLGLSTKANVARLAIGRSLALGSFEERSLDAKGREIPASSLFTQDDAAVWIGLVIAHARRYALEPITSLDAFRIALKKHWHRGAVLLLQDWEGADAKYDKFLETLMVRRAELSEDIAAAPGAVEDRDFIKIVPDNTSQLLNALTEIGVTAEIRGVEQGPRITRYKIYLSDVNHKSRLERGLDRVSLALNQQSASLALGPGDEARTISLDVPRSEDTWQRVSFGRLREWVGSVPAKTDELIVFLGVDVLGGAYSFDLTSAPHLLVAGTTGSGKSVCLQSLILSLILRLPPTTLKLALIDPKQVEFSVYDGCDYLYGDGVAVDVLSARQRIQELVTEMEARYKRFAIIGAQNIVEARRRGAEMPYIVVFIEELADLVLKDRGIEDQIIRLAQKARAAGIHLVLATQRPDAKTFSGLIRSNIPARIALRVQRGTESTIILDETGAETLLGKGDMLVKVKAGGQMDRVHGVGITREDVDAALKRKGLKIEGLWRPDKDG
jgi:S-DNA-T family DNA segregation ATPase FtsK/SpoIIIE